ncbi:hypothetical protein [Bacillus pseudomycoides]
MTGDVNINHFKVIQAFMREHRHQLMLVSLPLYSPNLNPIDRL